MEALDLFMQYVVKAALNQEKEHGKPLNKAKANAYTKQTGMNAYKKALEAAKEDAEDASFGLKTKQLTSLQKQAMMIGFKHAAAMYGIEVYKNSI